jgi:hypothetical protein
MRTCERIEARRIAGEPLDAEQRAHAAGCARCARSLAELERIERAAGVLAAFGPAPAGQAAAVRRAAAGRGRPRPAGRRLVLAGAALALGAIGVLALLLSAGERPGPQPQSPAAEQPGVLALMDEVDAITSGDADWGIADDGLAELLQADPIGQQVEAQDWELPGGYGALDELLGPRRL